MDMGYAVRLVVLILVLLVSVEVTAFSSGAPKRESVCLHRLPDHSVSGTSVVPQPEKPPYVITVNKTTVDHGDVIELTVESTGSYIRGFVVQAISTTPLDIVTARTTGKFLERKNTKRLSCLHDDDTVTHVSSDRKSRITLHFQVPSANIYRPFIFNGTVLQEFTKFWTNVSSSVIEPRGYKDNTIPDLSFQWLQTVSSVASSMQKGQRAWEDNIKMRMTSGFEGLVNSNGLVPTSYIKEFLPFELFEGSADNSPDSIELYGQLRLPPSNEISDSYAVTELLKGDLRFLPRVNKLIYKKLNVNKF